MSVRPMLTVVFILLSWTVRMHHGTTTEDGSNKYTDLFQPTEGTAEDEYPHVDGIRSTIQSNFQYRETSESEEAENFSSTWIPETTTVKESSTSIKYCPEITENYTIPESAPGSWAIPIDIICLYEDYTPARIHCFSNGTWNFTEKIECSSIIPTETTQTLHQLLLLNESSEVVLRNVSYKVETNLKELEIIDIHYIALILKKVSENRYNNVYRYWSFFGTIANMLETRRTRLRLSQTLLNSTDIVLEALSNDASIGFLFLHPLYASNWSEYIPCNSSEMIGLMIEPHDIRYPKLQCLHTSNYESTLQKTDFQFAYVIQSNIFSRRYRTVLYPSSRLFNSINIIGSPIVSILEDYSSAANIEVYFRVYFSSFYQTCSYWKYGTENGTAISGRWQFSSAATKFKDGYYMCRFSHTGHFTIIPEFFVAMCPEIQFQNHTIPETSAGSWAVPNNSVCLHEDNTPVRIKCLSNGTWDLTEDMSCSGNISKTTETLYEILNADSETALENVSGIIETNKDNLAPIDIYYISQILQKASTEDDVGSDPSAFIKTIDNVMNIEKVLLNSSQNLLNSTDTILYSLDLLLKANNDANFNTPKLLVRTITTSSNINGAMITSQNRDNFDSFQITYLNESYKDTLRNSEFEIAVIVPPLDDVYQYYITIFHNDNLFNQGTNPGTLGSWIISILLPDGTEISNSKLSIYFKEFKTSFDQQCQYWKYGIEYGVAISGYWKFDKDAEKFKEGYYMCEVNHTTHFGMLVSDSAPESFVLDLITILGSILSIMGIAIIFLTALVFKQWRKKPNSKIILNVALCLLLSIIVFIVSDKIERGTSCVVLGIVLHYLVLAQFFWALTMSYSSYRKFYQVYNDYIENIVVKFCAFSWLSPLLIIIITASINVHTYDKESNSSHICYPKGIYLQLGLLLPMAIILAINLVIYVMIAKSLCGTKLDVRRHETKRSFSIEKSLILLFFMLGITWTFGFLATFTEIRLFLYLFCTTATCHGFVIFVFYILDSPEITQLWKEKFKRMINKKSEPKSSDNQYTTTDANTTDSLTPPR